MNNSLFINTYLLRCIALKNRYWGSVIQLLLIIENVFFFQKTNFCLTELQNKTQLCLKVSIWTNCRQSVNFPFMIEFRSIWKLATFFCFVYRFSHWVKWKFEFLFILWVILFMHLKLNTLFWMHIFSHWIFLSAFKTSTLWCIQKCC